MSSINISSSSEDDGNCRYAAIADDKKRKRMISNRESARRSRMKREQHMKDLNDQITYFRSKSGEIARRIEEIGRRYAAVEAENRVLRSHGQELKKRLLLLEEMAASYKSSSARCIVEEDEDDDCFVMDVLQDPHHEPWLHPPFQSQTVDGIYQF
ncbi:bZIP transcription factor 53-like [Salvia miltiorrhiza]|uniref:bZIP transcription factor 53-like n=1 Tax=Salvia miltiorrhiza TaxID=226208 RepID=UPI0025AD04E6|nr:bZIP transcription factor 53-like [Salvia miltiorrhiza]